MKTAMLGTMLGLAGLTGCNSAGNNQDAIRKHTADATAAAARDAKSVVLGVVDGLRRKPPVNLNTATKEQLMTLPGVSGKIADGIIADRPYSRPADVLPFGSEFIQSCLLAG